MIFKRKLSSLVLLNITCVSILCVAFVFCFFACLLCRTKTNLFACSIVKHFKMDVFNCILVLEFKKVFFTWYVKKIFLPVSLPNGSKWTFSNASKSYSSKRAFSLCRIKKNLFTCFIVK